MTPKVFVSYRRDDSRDVTERLYEKLAAEFGAHKIFKDVDSIPVGTDFRIKLENAVRQSRAVVVVIGPGWVDVQDQNGARRLDQPDDFVRLEIESAFESQIPVVPVLIDHAQLPPPEKLPKSIQQLSYQQAATLRPDPDFQHDAERLISVISKFGVKRKSWLARNKIVLALGVTFVMIVIAVGAIVRFADQKDDTARPNPAAELMDVIKSSIARDAWVDSGGESEIKQLDGMLTVNANTHNHDKIHQFLSRLREARGLTQKAPPDSENVKNYGKILNRTIRVSFIETPLSEVVQHLFTMHQVSIIFDEAALLDAGLSMNDPVTFETEGIPLRAALKSMFDIYGLDYLVKEDHILITSQDVVEDALIIKVYDVRDLISSDPVE